MRLLDKLLGPKRQAIPEPQAAKEIEPPQISASQARWSEADNKGARQSTLDQADTYWDMRNMRQRFDPFVLYVFDRESDARSALLELDCCHEAEDTGALICTEKLNFGCYRCEDGKYGALLAGEDLAHDLWEKAKASFEKHGGQRKNEQEPEQRPEGETPAPAKPIAEVKLKRKYSEGSNTYEEYSCTDAEAAKEFLLTKSVDQPQYYLIIETPMGNWGLDIKGLYKERLLPWQTDLSGALVDGHTTGLPDSFALQMAAKGFNDNFVLSVICGNCGHQWMEGLRYQNWTVVQCPKCEKRNKVSTENYQAMFV